MSRNKETTFKGKFQDKFTELQHKYRIVVLNDDILDEIKSFRLSRLDISLIVSSVIVALFFLTLALIVFTPLKEYIPGYGDTSIRRQVVELADRTDSLNQLIIKQDRYIKNIKNILVDSVDLQARQESNLDSIKETGYSSDSVDLNEISSNELSLRRNIEQDDTYSLFAKNQANSPLSGLTDLYFFPPIKGYITDKFNADKKHFGVDIVAPEDEPIKAIEDGVVILASWTVETGHVIALQHKSNLVSFYKHNSVLLKKVGNFVKAGEAIAIIGSTGEDTTGPHLHFELWHQQIPVNPTNYINFN